MSQGLTLSILRLQEAWGLRAHGHQVVSVFHLVGIEDGAVHICKTTQEMCILQRGAKAEDMGGGPAPGKPHRVLLDYNIRVHSWCCNSLGFDKCIMAYISHYSIIQSSFTALKTLCARGGINWETGIDIYTLLYIK